MAAKHLTALMEVGAALALVGCLAGKTEKPAVTTTATLPAGATSSGSGTDAGTASGAGTGTASAETPQVVVAGTAAGAGQAFSLPTGKAVTLNADHFATDAAAYAKASLQVPAGAITRDTTVSLAPAVGIATIEAAKALGVARIDPLGRALAVAGDPSALSGEFSLTLPVTEKLPLADTRTVWLLKAVYTRTGDSASLNLELGAASAVDAGYSGATGFGIVQLVSIPGDVKTTSAILYGQSRPDGWQPQYPGEEWSPQLGDLGSAIGATLHPANFVASASTPSKVCSKWSPGAYTGATLPSVATTPEADEVSGLTFWGNHLYAMSDGTGSGPTDAIKIMKLDLTGSLVQSFEVTGVKGYDTEALSVGPCAGEHASTCLVIGDVGDNRRARVGPGAGDLAAATLPRLIYVKLAADLPDSVPAFKVVHLNLGQNDTEAMAVHPQSGDVILVAKSLSVGQNEPHATSFRLITQKTLDDADETTVVTPIGLGDLELFAFPTDGARWYELQDLAGKLRAQIGALSEISVDNSLVRPFLSKVVTDAAISLDGKRLMLTTYGQQIETDLDISVVAAAKDPVALFQSYALNDGHLFVPMRDYIILAAPDPLLKQAEAGTYIDARTFLVTTESFHGNDSPVVTYTCEGTVP